MKKDEEKDEKKEWEKRNHRRKKVKRLTSYTAILLTRFRSRDFLFSYIHRDHY